MKSFNYPSLNTMHYRPMRPIIPFMPMLLPIPIPIKTIIIEPEKNLDKPKDK